MSIHDSIIGKRHMCTMANKTFGMVILDVDPGIDDAYALAILLSAQSMGLIIKAIICSMGNTARLHSCRNLVRLLELTGNTDIPVYRGVNESLIRAKDGYSLYFGEDGFGNLNHVSDPNMDLVKKEKGPIALNEIVSRYPHEITLMIFGSMTNTALTMKLYENFAKKLKKIWIMGGNYKAIGNVSPVAEYNFHVDPEAARAVFESAKSPVTILPWEVCLENHIAKGWRFNVLGKVNNKFMQFLNKAEVSFYNMHNTTNTWSPCDAYMAAAYIWPHSILSQTEEYATVELCGDFTRGQTVIDHLHKHKPNVRIIDKMDVESFKHLIVQSVKSL